MSTPPTDPTPNRELRKFRELQLWTRGELKEKGGFSIQTITQYETGEQVIPERSKQRLEALMGVKFRGFNIPETEWVDITNLPELDPGAEVGWFLQEAYDSFDNCTQTSKADRWQTHKLSVVTGIPECTLKSWFDRFLRSGHTKCAYSSATQYVQKLRSFKENHFYKGKEHCEQLYFTKIRELYPPVPLQSKLPEQDQPPPYIRTDQLPRFKLMAALAQLIARLEAAPNSEYRMIEDSIQQLNKEIIEHNNYLLKGTK